MTSYFLENTESEREISFIVDGVLYRACIPSEYRYVIPQMDGTVLVAKVIDGSYKVLAGKADG